MVSQSTLERGVEIFGRMQRLTAGDLCRIVGELNLSNPDGDYLREYIRDLRRHHVHGQPAMYMGDNLWRYALLHLAIAMWKHASDCARQWVKPWNGKYTVSQFNNVSKMSTAIGEAVVSLLAICHRDGVDLSRAEIPTPDPVSVPAAVNFSTSDMVKAVEAAFLPVEQLADAMYKQAVPKNLWTPYMVQTATPSLSPADALCSLGRLLSFIHHDYRCSACMILTDI